jgi:membrane dipeptidase
MGLRMATMLLVDSHLDLAMNALLLNRDLTRNVHEIRKQEVGMPEKGRASGTVAFPEMRTGEVGVCLATILARQHVGAIWTSYRTPEIAYAAGQGQLAYYRILEREGVTRIITEWETLDKHVKEWQQNREKTPFGFVLSMEGADPVLSPEDIGSWWRDGLRVLSLVHYKMNAYACGTGTRGGLTSKGRELLEEMDSLGMVLDVTHLSEESFWEALDAFKGPIIASHNNCRALVPGERQFSDEQVRALVKRDAVIGVALDAWMLYPGWVRGETQNTVVSLEAVADQMDHIRQLVGNCRNIAVGSDLDGGFGKEQCPHDLDTIVDLQEIPGMLKKRGYPEEDIRNIMHGNLLRLFRKAWS